MFLDDTIAAIATPPGTGGIGIVRISGPRALTILERTFRRGGGRMSSHRLYPGTLIDPEGGGVIDHVLAVVMYAPHSYTGEDVVEIHGHGGALVMSRILSAVLAAGARHAEPGEFTRRAFLNGRIDLTQAEAVADIIHARSEGALRLAQRQLAGELGRRLSAFHDRLLTLLARTEAMIDFPEEDDVGEESEGIRRELPPLLSGMKRLLATFREGRILREGLSVAIVGRPNVGKSSLLNRLLRADRAIVTHIPGTTRDTLEDYAMVGGVPLRLIDTAGLRPTEDFVEAAGMERTRETIEAASLLLWVLDAADPQPEAEAEIARQIAGKRVIPILNKIDRLPAGSGWEIPPPLRALPLSDPIFTSMTHGLGLEELTARIVAVAFGGEVSPGEGVMISRERHRDALRRAIAHLENAYDAFEAQCSPEFAALDLSAALHALGEITGTTTTEDLLDRIFSTFCIGK
ncbi:MAG: tRNA uridine-5-carboxymethylaminomethyl(34) synthesis GTPase MnmE [Deltaproteobacteria bacterium]|nr:MAG: tRNA uridine-5-carboxymethylaminomethyl(34) synthesis GTPase MnmE [Deltaproteobacteria bacterium]